MSGHQHQRWVDSSALHWMEGLGNDNMKHYLLIIMVYKYLMDVVSYSRIFTSYRDKLTKFWNASSINFTFREVMLMLSYLVLSISFSNISVSTRPILVKHRAINLFEVMQRSVRTLLKRTETCFCLQKLC